ncbi:MAG: SUMF1/EgtB/PvdO family nonheme iron enzyme [Candidatus Pacebacteria bacterium]|nr:SUMF1/EgtB/PvdO family nonheme iron enzyme [Candidatus Paceibacterota bacterium]
MEKLEQDRSFTLIELLVVIVIIGILAGVIAISTNSAVTSSQNTKLVANPSNISKFLEGYSIQESRHTKTQDIQKSCESGWIPFENRCIMQYEAKDVFGVATSQVGSIPWVSIDQKQAKAECEKIGAHLITNAEWMAIARDIEQVKSNWTGGSVGSGMIKRGNVGITDAGSYEGATDPEAGVTNDLAKLTLSNGKQIYHFSGNVWEWVDETRTNAELLANFNSQSSNWYEYNGTIVADFSKAIILPYSMAGPKAAHNSANGVGKIYVDTDASWSNNTPYDNTIHAFLRGGGWISGANAGVFALLFGLSPTYTNTNLGFRCAR